MTTAAQKLAALKAEADECFRKMDEIERNLAEIKEQWTAKRDALLAEVQRREDAERGRKAT